MNIQPIVEGYGEVTALPILLRRLIYDHAHCHAIHVKEPIRCKQHEFFRETDVHRIVRFATMSPDCGAVLVVFDADDECPAALGPRVREWARAASGAVPCEVVVAHREYESWFLAALESLQGCCRIRVDAVAPADPERKRNAKGELERFMPRGASYSPTIHQPKFSALFNLELAHQRSRSFRKLTKAVGELLVGVGQPLPTWPPEGW